MVSAEIRNMTTTKNSLAQILQSIKTSKIRYKAEPMLSYSEFSGLEAKFTPQILVTGTNGKGSVCSALSSILQTAGYKTGLFLTPHLTHPRERMLVNGREITDSRMKRLYESIKTSVHEFTKKTGWELTFFEWMLLLAILWFYEEKCDIAIFEAGLGGMRDASRCLKPLVAAITNVSSDHLHILGPELRDVAREKSAVFFRSKYGVLGLSQELSKQILSMPETKECQFFAQEEFIKLRSMTITGMNISLYWKQETMEAFSSLTGAHQIDNLNCALNILQPIQNQFPVSTKSVHDGLKNIQHKCRMETLCSDPLVIVDGCHNAEGLKYLRANLDTMFSDHQVIYCLAMKHSKFHENLQNIMAGCKLWLVPHREKGFMPAKELQSCFPSGLLLKGRREVWEKFLGLGIKKKVLVYCGSLRFAGLVRNDFLRTIRTKSYKKG
jgi:dihydrofolate synthase/folylpolyglutamate synthase